jgi:hypothetical protein
VGTKEDDWTVFQLRGVDMTTLKSVPTVEVRHLVLVDNYILAVGPGLTFAEFVISAARILPGTLDVGSILSVVRRLSALDSLLNLEDRRHQYVNEPHLESKGRAALLRTAARAPLIESERINKFIFDRETFAAILAEEVKRGSSDMPDAA